MIKQVSKDDYDIRESGHPQMHQNLAWYASEDDRVLGVVVRDKIDNDFGWVILTVNDQGPGYTAVDLNTSLASEEVATEQLHSVMAVHPLP